MIKFRAWDRKDKRIRDVNTISFHNKKASFDYDDSHLPKIIWLWGYDIIEQKDILLSRKPNDVTLVQYTGLKDKNGKEIYEGDIVKLRGEVPYSSESITTDYDWEMEGEIIEQGGCYWIRVREDKSIWIPLFEYFNGDMELEVIGNIYENHELLEEMKNSEPSFKG